MIYGYSQRACKRVQRVVKWLPHGFDFADAKSVYENTRQSQN